MIADLGSQTVSRWLCSRVEGRAVERGAGARPEGRRLPADLRRSRFRRSLGSAVLHDMLRQLRQGDVVVAWTLDRLTRPLRDLLHLIEPIEGAGAGFRSLAEAIDSTTPAGRLMMQMVASFAELERAMIRERTSVGRAQARAEGRIGGRRKKRDPKKRADIAESVLSGRKSAAEMARLYDISQPTVSRIVVAYRQMPVL